MTCLGRPCLLLACEATPYSGLLCLVRLDGREL